MALFCASAVVGMASAKAADTELRCETKYHFFPHLRGSTERGDCNGTTAVDGPALDPVLLDARGGKNQKKDRLVAVEVSATKPKESEAKVSEDTFLTKIKQLKVDERYPTSTEGHLRPEAGDLVLQQYINEVDEDSKNPCVNSRYLKVTCRLVPKK